VDAGGPTISSPTTERKVMVMTGMEGVQVLSISLGYVMGQAMHAAATLRIPDAMATGPASPAEISAATGTHPPSLERLLRTLASGGIVTRTDDGRYQLTTMGETLRSDVPGSVRDAVLWVSAPMHYGSCGDLAHAVKTGQPAFDGIFGSTYFDHLARDAESSRVWDAGMANFSSMEDHPIAHACTVPDRACVVDIGGGQGGFLAEILTANPSVRGVLFDRAHVVSRPQRLVDARLEGRYETMAGDFFDAVPAGGDVYVYKRVLHDWDDDQCIAMLRNCRAVIPPTGRLLVIDAVIPPGDDPHPAKIVDLVMMGILPGRERTADEFARLLDQAAFEMTGVVATHSMLAVVEARPRVSVPPTT
jgi:O-methyltransferase domain/Dimerisation domain